MDQVFLYMYEELPKFFKTFFILAGAAQTLIIVALGDMKMVRKLLLVQTTTSPTEFRELVSTWSQQDLDAFRNHFYMDLFVYPILYTLFCISWLGIEVRQTTFKPVNFVFKAGAVSFVVGGACDIVENFIHYNSIENFKRISDAHIQLAAYFSITKWAIMLTGLACMSVSYVRRTCFFTDRKRK